MDPVKEAFQKIKEDMNLLKEEINSLKEELFKLNNPTIPTHNPTNNHDYSGTPTHNPTLPQEMKGFQQPNFDISTGNEGVPTDKQTNQPTNPQTDKIPYFQEFPTQKS
ncbi:hypothetical protein H8D91_01380, partial [archaeon]|nr:hypothetical protein [archaeon]